VPKSSQDIRLGPLRCVRVVALTLDRHYHAADQNLMMSPFAGWVTGDDLVVDGSMSVAPAPGGQ